MPTLPRQRLVRFADYKQKELDVNVKCRRFKAEQLFSLGDFNLWKITPKSGIPRGAWQGSVAPLILYLRL
jgi:hypothetical protein